MRHIPDDVRYLFYLGLLSGTLLLIWIHLWLATGVVLSIMAFWKIWNRKRVPYDVEVVGIVHRKKDNDLKYVLPKLDRIRPQPYDLLGDIEKKALKNIGVFGIGGSGKSGFLSWIGWQYTDPAEVSKYGIEPVTTFAFNYHRFQPGHGDFEGLNFEYVNIAENLPHIFNPEYKEFLLRAFSVVFVSVLRNYGIMASSLSDVFREILEHGSYPRNWEEFKQKVGYLEKHSSGIKQQICSIVALRIGFFDTGNVRPIDFDFTKSLILDFAHLPNDESKNLYSEFYANLIYKKGEEKSIAGQPHSIMLLIDECHRLVQYSDYSITADILRNARKHMRIVLATQNLTDVHEGLRHFQVMQFRTNNPKDVDAITKLNPLHMDGVRQMGEHDFVWVNDGNTEVVPVFRLNIKRIEEFKRNHPQIYADKETENTFILEEQEKGVERKTGEEFNRENIENKIVRVVGEEGKGLWKSEILENLKIGKDNRRYSYVYDIIEGMKKRIRIVDYVTPTLKQGKKPRRLVIDGVSEIGAESQLHRRLLDDTEKVLKELDIKYETGKLNQGFDFILEKCYIEAETNLKRSLGEWASKCEKADNKIVCVLPNEDARKRYSSLEVVNNEKVKLVLLNELAEILRSFGIGKIKNTT